jgi:hypothetical protein
VETGDEHKLLDWLVHFGAKPFGYSLSDCVVSQGRFSKARRQPGEFWIFRKLLTRWEMFSMVRGSPGVNGNWQQTCKLIYISEVEDIRDA